MQPQRNFRREEEELQIQALAETDPNRTSCSVSPNGQQLAERARSISRFSFRHLLPPMNPSRLEAEPSNQQRYYGRLEALQPYQDVMCLLRSLCFLEI